ncbi:MAG TPA: acetyltransferase [Tepidisphaeraceae bacterium]|nr:acetyltransferase [Tepidisphaeraceae bacterium]
MEVLIIGAGGHGKVVLDILRAAGEHHPVGFLDADATLAGTQVGGLEVLGHVNLLPRLRQQRKARGAIVAIGDNRVRTGYARLVLDSGLELINAIHPRSIVSSQAVTGRNVVIAAGAIVCAEARLGDSVIANTGCVIDHECEIGPASHICPGALLAGRVRIGTGVFVGLGARILPCLSVGDHAVVGAGAVVLKDVDPGTTVVGVPARVIKSAH